MTRAAGAMTAGQARELLGLSPGAGDEALARAYRAAVKSAHPDLEGGDAERLRQVVEAHRVLRSLASSRVVFPPAPRPAAAASQSFPLKITVREALFGGRRRLTGPGGRFLEVRLPKGLRVGDALRLAGMGDGGADLVARIGMQVEAGVQVRGGDVWLEIEAGAGQLRPGSRLEVDTPRGRRAVVAPQGAADGRPVRLKGEGLPPRGRHPAGDLILKLKLQPEAPASRELLRRFSARWAA